MRIISERQLTAYWEKHATAGASMKEWRKIVRVANWEDTTDIRLTFNSVDFHKGLTIFNVGGNNYRIITKIEYRTHIVFMKFVMSHVEYNDHEKWCGCGKK